MVDAAGQLLERFGISFIDVSVEAARIELIQHLDLLARTAPRINRRVEMGRPTAAGESDHERLLGPGVLDQQFVTGDAPLTDRELLPLNDTNPSSSLLAMPQNSNLTNVIDSTKLNRLSIAKSTTLRFTGNQYTVSHYSRHNWCNGISAAVSAEPTKLLYCVERSANRNVTLQHAPMTFILELTHAFDKERQFSVPFHVLLSHPVPTLFRTA